MICVKCTDTLTNIKNNMKELIIKTNTCPELYIVYNTINKNIHIKNSYLITNDKIKRMILQEINYQLKNQNITFNRSFTSQLHEWKGHNTLYQWNYKRSSTQSVDINENESTMRKIGFTILSWFERTTK